jgi:hypothetical protein
MATIWRADCTYNALNEVMHKMKADLATRKQWYKTATDEWSSWRTEGRKSFAYYMGEQWSSETKDKLARQSKPALTINRIKPIIRTLSGYMRQNRRDLKVLPRRGGTESISQIYTKMLKHVSDESDYDYVSAGVFLDGIICGKGFMSVDIDYQKDPISGQVVITREDPFLILEDPFSTKYDLSDAKYIYRMRWMDKEMVKKMFPKADDDAFWSDLEGLAGTEEIDRETDDYPDDPTGTDTEAKKQRHLVKECWYKTWENKKLLVDRLSGQIEDYNSFDDDPEENKAIVDDILLNSPSSEVVTRMMPVLHLAITVGDKDVSYTKDPYNGMTDFPIVRFADELIYADKPMVRGEVSDIIDAQDELNKRRSQALHLINTTANSGYIVEKGALSKGQRRNLESMGSKAGVVIETEQGGLNKIKRIEPSQLSTGHVELSQLADGDMKAISGVNADLLGMDDTSATSGIAMEMRRRQGLINVEPVFDNYDNSQKILGKVLLEIIRNVDVYTPAEISYLIGDKIKLADGNPITPEEIIEYLDNPKGQYGVKMSQQDSNPTQRKADFKEMVSFIKEIGIPVPPEMLLEHSDFAFKDELLAQMEQQQQGMPQPQGGGVNPVDPVQQQAMADMVNAGGQPL